MQRDLASYLWDIAEAIAEIRAFACNVSINEYLANKLLQRAIERDFEIIGEAIKQAERLYPGSLDTLPSLRAAIAFRDRLAHGYFATDPQVAWRAITAELPQLEEAVLKLLPPES